MNTRVDRRWTGVFVSLGVLIQGGSVAGQGDCSSSPRVPPDLSKFSESTVVSEVVRSGGGTSQPDLSDQVLVHYCAWNADGELVDSSFSRGEPETYRLDRVIEGWKQVIPQMQVGEIRRLWIPSSLAYGDGDDAYQGPLVYEIELLEINPQDDCEIDPLVRKACFPQEVSVSLTVDYVDSDVIGTVRLRNDGPCSYWFSPGFQTERGLFPADPVIALEIEQSDGDWKGIPPKACTKNRPSAPTVVDDFRILPPNDSVEYSFSIVDCWDVSMGDEDNESLARVVITADARDWYERQTGDACSAEFVVRGILVSDSVPLKIRPLPVPAPRLTGNGAIDIQPGGP